MIIYTTVVHTEGISLSLETNVFVCFSWKTKLLKLTVCMLKLGVYVYNAIDVVSCTQRNDSASQSSLY